MKKSFRVALLCASALLMMFGAGGYAFEVLPDLHGDLIEIGVRTANRARRHGAASLLRRDGYVWVRADGLCCGDPGDARRRAGAPATRNRRSDLHRLRSDVLL